MKKKTRSIIFLYVAALIVLFIIIYVFPKLGGALERTSLIEYGEISTSNVADLIVIRDEGVAKSEDEGEIHHYFDDGDFLRKGTKVLDIAGNQAGYKLKNSAYISYTIDGLEKKLTPESISELSKRNIDKMKPVTTKLKTRRAAKGQPLYKAVKNNYWYVLFWLEKEEAINYQKGKAVTLKTKNEEVLGKVHFIKDEGKYFRICLAFNRNFDKFLNVREMEAKIITLRVEGLIVANKSITVKNGQTGVYVKDVVGEFNFVPVSVIATDGEYSAVKNEPFLVEVDGKEKLVKTVKVYDEILNHPGKEKQ